jgi:hypothetical protein
LVILFVGRVDVRLGDGIILVLVRIGNDDGWVLFRFGIE